MKSMIKELWHGNIIPGEDSRNSSKEMKELLGEISDAILFGAYQGKRRETP